MTATLTGAPAPAVGPPRAGTAWWVPVGAAACLVLWLVSLPLVDVGAVAGFGLLDAVPALWVLAFAGTVLTYLGALLSRRPVGHQLAACQLVLVAVLYGTTSVVYDVARYPWSFKHVGVVEYLLAHGTVDRSIDIYQNFPGFFYAAAAVHEVTGVPVLDLARWAQPFFALVTAAAVYWVVGAFSTSRRVRYGAVLLYTLGDWIGQNYFAPQAMAFPLALVVLGGLLRSVSWGPDALRWAGLRRLLPVGAGADLPPPSRFWSSRAGAAALLGLVAVVVVSHPLSPMILIAQSAVVCVLVRPARPWLVPAFVAVEAGWLALCWPFLDSTYHLLDFGLSNVTPPKAALVHPLAGQAVALWAAPLLMAVIGLLAAGGVVGAVRRGEAGRVVVPVALALVAVVPVLAQPYGKEGIFRAYLFGLPFLALVAARQLFRDRSGDHPGAGLRRLLLSGGAVVVIGALTLPADFSAEMIDHVASSDLAADAWFEEATPAGSALLPFASEFPVRTTGDYARHLPRPSDGVLGVLDLDGFAGSADSADELVRFTHDACDSRPGTGPVYLAVGPSAEAHVRLYGAMGLGVYHAYLRALAVEPGFTRVFAQGSSVVYRCR